MKSSQIAELSKKVEKIAKEFVLTKKENVRLKRMLGVAEAKIKKLIAPGVTVNGGMTALVKQIEKLKEERKMIKTRVEKMTSKLEKFYEA